MTGEDVDADSGDGTSGTTLHCVKVRDPRGQTWRVTRRWVPWRRRLKGYWELTPRLPTLGDDPISLIITGLLLIVMLPIFLLVIVSGLEFLLLLLVLPFAIVGRMLFGQHWTIEARQGWDPVWEESAGSWTESGQAIKDVAAAIARGQLPPTTLG